MKFNNLQKYNIGIVPTGIRSSDTRSKPQTNENL